MAFSTATPMAYFTCSNPSTDTLLSSSSLKSLKIPRLIPPFWPWEKVKMGPLTVSPMGFGTWAWGNQLLWGYQESMDTDLQRTFNLAVENGINLFDTADSYGTGRLNGQSEKLLGRFVREFEGQKRVRDNILIATKFAAYPWRLTPGQFDCLQVLSGSEQIEQIGRAIALVNCKLRSFAGVGSLGWFSGNV
ncbi:hypothetical protein L1049_006394 [Liquidambar formosana]|uniref:NADP-dependent oxidoreductase domain-containing protein n=1 Tax=Liquidambar formosana TaxID=63359 RepID=A0AAP0RGY1_LIQFO